MPLFITALYYLIIRPYPQINKPVLASILVLFMLGTMHVAGSIKIMLDAFITFADRPGGPAALFANEAEPINLFRKSVFAISVLVGDGLVVRYPTPSRSITSPEIHTDISLFHYLVP